MKLVLPILICSAITGALGYYFGHITIPAENQASRPVAEANLPAEQQPSAFEQTSTPEPASPPPIEPPTLQTPAVEEMTEPVEQAPDTSDAAFAERAASTTQTLTDTQGRSIQASIVKVTDTEVKIRRSDGLETTIPLNMLSEEDVAFCNYLREQQKAEEVKTPDSSDGFDWDAYFNS
ncbi:MAG TPA: hypothetical protein VJ952_08000 [Opitutales bacterium]|nr:hypothetical protein [Opitutales bacterium]